MDAALHVNAVDLAHDEYADVQSREAPLAIPTPDYEQDEVTVHVHLDGEWHRELTHRLTTCEKQLSITGLWRRPKKYDATDGKYCSICFTPREIREANAMKAATVEVERELADEFAASDWRTRKPRTDTERSQRISQRLEQKLILEDPNKDDKP